MSLLPKAIYKLDTIPIKIQMALVFKINLKIYMDHKRPHIAKETWRKNQVEVIKIYYKASIEIVLLA